MRVHLRLFFIVSHGGFQDIHHAVKTSTMQLINSKFIQHSQSLTLRAFILFLPSKDCFALQFALQLVGHGCIAPLPP